MRQKIEAYSEGVIPSNEYFYQKGVSDGQRHGYNPPDVLNCLVNATVQNARMAYDRGYIAGSSNKCVSQ